MLWRRWHCKLYFTNSQCISRKGECLQIALIMTMMIVMRESVRRVIVCGLCTIYHLPAVGWAGRNFRFRICVSLTHVGSWLEMWNCLFSVQISLRRFRRFLGHQITTRTAYYYWPNIFLLQIFFSCKKSTSHFYLLIFHIQRVRFWLKKAERWKLSWAPSAKGWPRACHSQRAGFWPKQDEFLWYSWALSAEG